MKKRKVCFVAPCLSLGGMENAASIMANYFAQEDFDVSFLTLFNRPHFYKLNESIEIIDPPGDRSKGNKLWYYLKIVFFLRKHIKEISPDRVFSYGDWTNILPIMASLGLRVNVFISDRASPELKFQWYEELLRRALYRRVNGIIAQTNRAADQKFRMLGPDINLKVIPNPVKPVKLYPEINRKNVILGVGRHWKVKGLDRLIDAFFLISDGKNFSLKIAGSKGPETQSLLDLLSRHQLNAEEILIEKVEDMDKLYAESKIFVLTSRSEGYPNALIEAMAAGLACISFDISAGPSDIITPGEDGILVENGNIHELSNQIQFLLNNADEIERLGGNALKIRERLSLGSVGKEYVDFIMN